jgi:hypothetical protein
MPTDNSDGIINKLPASRDYPSRETGGCYGFCNLILLSWKFPTELYRDRFLAPLECILTRIYLHAITFVPPLLVRLARGAGHTYLPCTMTAFCLKIKLDSTWMLRRVTHPPFIAGPLGLISGIRLQNKHFANCFVIWKQFLKFAA